MRIDFEVTNVQHVNTVRLSIDLTQNKPFCIVGKNGVGKTTLIKAIRNLALADTFKRTSSDSIFKPQSVLTYTIDDEEYRFQYDETIRSLNCKKAIPDIVKSNVDVELPLPHGQRFSFFQTISDIDPDIRRAVVLEQYSEPEELIAFLNDIYDTDKFNALKAVTIKGIHYYCFILPDSRYIREDYFSSGEYFLISLYRKIKNRCKLIAIDEIDISLDAAAQVRLVKWLRGCCTEFGVNVLFTTHSLAMIRMLKDDERYYMQAIDGGLEITQASYNYIKSVMFGFNGWDKYILTEDSTLESFLRYVINRYCTNTFFKYQIIYIGPATSVADLLRRNETEEFLSAPGDVIAVLDGDQRGLDIARQRNTFCLPFDSVEKAIYYQHMNGGVHAALPTDIPLKQHKRVFNDLISRRLMTQTQIFGLLCDIHAEGIEEFAGNLRRFLCPAVVQV